MASAFGHAFAAIALGSTFKHHLRTKRFWILGIFCSIFPDADVIAFKLGIPYESFWGHRGFTHSIVFAILFGLVIAFLFHRNAHRVEKLRLAVYYFLCTVSHALLDAFTNGGLGVALFSPIDNVRYFFPFRPIQVSPIGIQNFLGEKGIAVISSEAIWIGIPCLVLIVAGWVTNGATRRRGV